MKHIKQFLSATLLFIGLNISACFEQVSPEKAKKIRDEIGKTLMFAASTGCKIKKADPLLYDNDSIYQLVKAHQDMMHGKNLLEKYRHYFSKQDFIKGIQNFSSGRKEILNMFQRAFDARNIGK